MSQNADQFGLSTLLEVYGPLYRSQAVSAPQIISPPAFGPPEAAPPLELDELLLLEDQLLLEELLLLEEPPLLEELPLSEPPSSSSSLHPISAAPARPATPIPAPRSAARRLIRPAPKL